MQPGRRVYEWRFNLRRAASDGEANHRVVGFDVVATDKDTDGSFSWVSWGPGTYKMSERSSLGDLVVCPVEPTDGEIRALLVGQYNRVVTVVRQTARAAATRQTSFFVVPLLVALVHVGLFCYEPTEKRHVFYAAYSACVALRSLAAYQVWYWNWGGTDIGGSGIWLPVVVLAGPLSEVTGLLFLCRQFHWRVPRLAWLVFIGIAGQALVGVAGWVMPAWLAPVSLGITLAVRFEALRLVALAVRRNLDGAWFFAAGVGLLVFPGIYLRTAYYLGAFPPEVPGWAGELGLVGQILAVSSYVVRDAGRASRRRVLLEAENQRRGYELAEARELQQSMLPRRAPEVQQLEVAYLLRPAVEVGGDYYDYALAGDGTLTVVLGDATGHGMRAGVLVATTKGIFNTLGQAADPATQLASMSSSLRRMQLGRAGMSLLLARFRGSTLTVSSAGMPPVLVYRAADGSVEEILVPGPPPGLSSRPAYRESSVTLATGDCVLAMSDGLPERTDPTGQPFGYPRCEEAFRAAAALAAEAACESMAKAGDQWANGRPQDDHCAFVVIRVK